MTNMTKKAGIRAGISTGLKIGSSDRLSALVVERGVMPVKALSAFYWIGAWGVCADQFGREPRSVDEVATALGMSLRTAFKWQATFRAVFPEYSTPATLWELVHDQVHSDDPVQIGLQLGAAIL